MKREIQIIQCVITKFNIFDSWIYEVLCKYTSKIYYIYIYIGIEQHNRLICIMQLYAAYTSENNFAQCNCNWHFRFTKRDLANIICNMFTATYFDAKCSSHFCYIFHEDVKLDHLSKCCKYWNRCHHEKLLSIASGARLHVHLTHPQWVQTIHKCYKVTANPLIRSQQRGLRWSKVPAVHLRSNSIGLTASTARSELCFNTS